MSQPVFIVKERRTGEAVLETTEYVTARRVVYASSLSGIALRIPEEPEEELYIETVRRSVA